MGVVWVCSTLFRSLSYMHSSVRNDCSRIGLDNAKILHRIFPISLNKTRIAAKAPSLDTSHEYALSSARKTPYDKLESFDNDQ